MNSTDRDFSSRVHELERSIVQLDDLAKPWNQTFVTAKESSVPPEVLARVENIIHEIRQARDAVEKQRGRVLTMQTRVGMQDSRVANALMSIDQARESALDRLFLRESTPIWHPAIGSRDAQDLTSESLNSFARQWDALRTYTDRQAMPFVLGLAVFSVLTACFYWTRRGARRLPAEEAAAAPLFEMPIAAALVLSLLGSRWIFPQAPRVLWAMLGTLALVPSVLILRRLMRAELHPLLYALIALFLSTNFAR